MIVLSWTYSGTHFTKYANQTIMLYALGFYMICVNYFSIKLKKIGSETLLDQKDGRDWKEMAANSEWLAETEITGEKKNSPQLKKKSSRIPTWSDWDFNLLWYI